METADEAYKGYHEVMNAVMATKDSGIGVYDMCIAYELTAAIKEQVKSIRQKKARDIILSNTDGLYRISRGVYYNSAGACSPKDAAFTSVACYMHCGMNIEKTERYTKNVKFAIKFINR